MTEDAAARTRRLQRQELLERRQMSLSWRHRLLDRRLKQVKGRQDLARHLAAMEPPAIPQRYGGQS